MDGKPHLGTDRLVLILRGMRLHLQQLGATFMFGECFESFLTTRSSSASGPARVTGVRLRGGLEIPCSEVVLAAGHSSRVVHDALRSADVKVVPKAFAAGFRVSGIETPSGSLSVARIIP